MNRLKGFILTFIVTLLVGAFLTVGYLTEESYDMPISIYQVYLDRFTEFNVTVLTSSGDPGLDRCFKVDNSLFYSAMLDEVCEKLEGKPSRLASLEEMITSVRVALAAKASKENDGETISIDDDQLEDVSYDGYAFEREYAESARKIYL